MENSKPSDDCGCCIAIDWDREEKSFNVYGYFDTKVVFKASFPAANIFDNPKAESIMEFGAVNTVHESKILETKNHYLQTVYDHEPMIFDMPTKSSLQHAVTGISYLIENCETRKGEEKIVIDNHIAELQNCHKFYKVNKQLVGERIKFFDKEIIPNLTRDPTEDGKPIPKELEQDLGSSPNSIRSALEIINQLDDLVSIQASTSSGLKISYGKPSE